MKISCAAVHAVVSILAALYSPQATAQPELVAQGQFSGSDRDHSGLTEEIAPGVVHNQLGGFSALEYSGFGTTYYALPDRGAQDGAFPYQCRFQVVDIRVSATASSEGCLSEKLSLKLLETRLLFNAGGSVLTGLASAIDSADPEHSLRFDPEGFRCATGGSFFVSDEYGPTVSEFVSGGRRLRSFAIPEHFRIKHPSGSPQEEADANSSGRQPNRGFEGLAISPNGGKLFAVLQGPLIQDSVALPNGKRSGIHLRLLEIDRHSGQQREFVYPLDDPRNGVSEILAINDDNFLLIERDSTKGSAAAYKKIIHATTQGATNISGRHELPAHELSTDIRRMQKSILIDLLDPKYFLRGDLMPEKIEGLTFGPDLPDGRRLLMICSDNDFVTDEPSRFYAFGINSTLLPGFAWER